MNVDCRQCAYYVKCREYTQFERDFMKQRQVMIDIRQCSIGGCDGSRFLDKNRNAERGAE